MTWTKLSSTDSGAPQLLGVNGSLTNVFRWALPQLGWAIEYGASGNAAVFRAASGNRHRFCINNNNGASGIAIVRGALAASGATTWTNTFPTTTQCSNEYSCWPCGHYDGVTPAEWFIYGNETFFYFIYVADMNNNYLNFFGDLPSYYNTGWETAISVSASYNYASAITAFPIYNGVVGYNGLHWARRIDGVTLSTLGSLHGAINSFCYTHNAPPTRGGYLNRVMRQKIGLTCNGSNSDTVGSLGIIARGWLPNLWNPMHTSNTTLSARDTFTDSVYNPSAIFRWYSFNGNTYGFIIEETDTWSKP